MLKGSIDNSSVIIDFVFLTNIRFHVREKTRLHDKRV